MENERIALSLSLLMLIHNVPEGVAVCLPLRLSGMRVAKILWLAFLTGIPTAAGALLGTAVGSVSPAGDLAVHRFCGRRDALSYRSGSSFPPRAKKKRCLRFWGYASASS